MKRLKSYKKAVTLPEVLTVIVIVVLVTVISMPALDTFFDSMASQGSTEAMINAALSSARAMATSEHKYVGIRFQKIYDERGPLYADQYLIFIVYDYDRTDLANGFRAVEGIKPIKLPESIGVMDLYYGSESDQPIDDEMATDVVFFSDATTFSIVFSPAGRLIVHDVRVQIYNDIFNTVENVEAKLSMFIVDDYFAGNGFGNPELGFGPEPSRREFLIYDRKEFRRTYDNGRPFSDYLKQLASRPFYINPYTGTIISQGQ